MLASILLCLPLQASPEAVELFRTGRRHEAVERMAAELVADPDDPLLRRSLVECELSLKAYASALEHAGARAELTPLRARALFFLGRFEEALAYLDRSRPEDVLLVVDALEALGRMAEVERATDDALGVLGSEHPAARVLAGRAAARGQRWDEAAGHFRAALASDPTDAAALFGLGRALVRAGAREEGLAVLAEHRRLLPLLDELEFARRSLELAPRHAPNHAALADVLRRLGRTQDALAGYRRAAELASEDQAAAIALRHARLLHEDLGQGERALEVLSAALGRTTDVRLHVRLGDVAASLGRSEDARRHYADALALRPGDAALLERLRRLEVDAGRTRDGR